MSNEQLSTAIDSTALEAADFEVAETKPEGVAEIAPLSGPLHGTITVPGDKSISHRAVLFSAMAEGTSRVMGVLDSEDVRSSIRCVSALGAEVSLEKQPDGSLAFWQLSLTCESDDFKGWAGEETIVPDTATVTTVRLVPTENGWRVDALELPN